MTFLNEYHCEDCELSWADVWDAQCDDKCPKCHKAYCPEVSTEILGKYHSQITSQIPSQIPSQSPKECMEFTD